MNKTVIEICKKVVSYVEENKHIPSKITVNGVSYNYGSYAEILASAIVNKDTIPTKKVYDNAPSPKGEKINRKYSKDEYIRMAKMTVAFYQKQKRCPNYLHFNGKKILPRDWIYAFARIVKFLNEKQRYPNSVLINSNYFKTTTTKKTTKGGTVCKSLTSKTGVTITDYRTLYNAFKKFEYHYYYNDVQTQSQTISRMTGNCADLNQVAYYALKELGYKADIVRGTVKCTSGTFGHIWCRLKLTSVTINFDASAAAKGKRLGNLICGTGTVTNTNPSWLLSDDGRT